MPLGQIGSAMSELSQMMAQAVRLPLRRPGRAAGPRSGVRVLARAGTGGRGQRARFLGSLWLAAGAVPDDVVVDLIREVGGRRARAVILPAAAYGGAEAGERYRRFLRRFGMDHVDTVAASTRRQADEPATAQAVAAADLVVVAGGDPGLLLDTCDGTAVTAALDQALARGAAVAAWGPASEAAGEWILPALPADGPPGADRGRRRGLALLPGTVVASAPHGPGRIGALFGAALQEGLQALLLDERTVLAVRPGWQAEVRSGVALAAGAPPVPRRDQATPGRRQGGSPGAVPPVGGVWTRVAPAGWRLDLAGRSLLPPGGAPEPAGPGAAGAGGVPPR